MALDDQIRALVPAISAQVKSLRTALGLTAPAVKLAAFSFGGAVTIDTDWGSNTSMSERTRWSLVQQPNRFRVHIKNYCGKSDQAVTGTGPNITSVFIGQQDTTTLWDCKAAPVQLGVGTNPNLVGTNEFVSAWTAPPFDMTQPLVLSFGWTMSGSTPLVTHNSSHSIQIDTSARANDKVVGTPAGANSSSTWYDYGYSIFEVWVEYEIPANGPRIGYVVSHSLGDSTQGDQLHTPGYDGQMTGWPQKVARRHGDAVTVNAYASSRTTDWSSSSTKWARFPGVTPDYVILDITGNDVDGNLTAAQTDTNLRGIIAKVASLWPSAQIYVTTCPPISNETLRKQIDANIGALMPYQIDGIFDFNLAVRNGTDPSAWDPILLGADGIHPNNRGHDRLADAVTISGSSGGATLSTRITVGTTAPTNPSANDLWVDTN